MMAIQRAKPGKIVNMASGGWPDSRITNLFEIEFPIIQAPMAGANGSDLAVAVSEAGGLGFLPCGAISLDQIRSEVASIRDRTAKPFGLNFFCHQPPEIDPDREAEWRRSLAKYYVELGLDPNSEYQGIDRQPFDEAACDLVLELKTPVVSFHFGLPKADLLDRMKAAGTLILSSATTVEEAKWLEDHGCDAIFAQGVEAGGHRAMFLSDDISTQIGTMVLVPRVVDAVKVPIIATGGIMDSRGIVAALALGASAVQLGTAYLLCPESTIGNVHREAIRQGGSTTLTNVFSGRPARGIVNRFIREVGPMSPMAPQFPRASSAVAPLRAASEKAGSQDFAQMWSGDGGPMAVETPAHELTIRLANETLAILKALTNVYAQRT